MRWIARVLVLSGLVSFLAGCQSIHRPWARIAYPEKAGHPLDEPPVRTARDAVPDSVMLPEQVRGSYNESPSGQ